MKTLIISAFPGCGKSYFFKERKDLKVLDSDSSEFSWVKDINGNNTKERNPEFPNNYISHIKENIGKVNIIFVSTHKVVRDALYNNINNSDILLIYPSRENKSTWIDRFKHRGNDEGFIKMMDFNWDMFIDEMEEERNRFNVSILNKNDYISNVINF